MKWTFILVLVSASCSVFAGDLSNRCVKRIVKYRSRIQGSANAVIDNYSIAESSGDPLDANDFQIIADARRVDLAVTQLVRSKRLDQRELSILNHICNLRSLDSDSLSTALESLDETKRPFLSKSCHSQIKSVSSSLLSSASENLSRMGSLRVSVYDMDLKEIQTVATSVGLTEAINNELSGKSLTGLQFKLLSRECTKFSERHRYRRRL